MAREEEALGDTYGRDNRTYEMREQKGCYGGGGRIKSGTKGEGRKMTGRE